MDNYHALDSGSSFQENLEEIKKLDALISQAMQQREQKINNNESVFVMDRQIGQQVQKQWEQLKAGQQSLMDDNKIKKISQQETQRLKNILDNYSNRIEEFNRKLNQKQLFKINAPQSDQQDLSGKSNIELVQMQQKLYNKQEGTIDNMLAATDKIGNNVKTMGQQLDEDKIILRRLGDNVDKTTTNIQDTDNRLKGLLRRTSDCCLWTTIIVEFMIFIFLVIY